MRVTVPWILVANLFNRVLTMGTQLVIGFLLVPEQVGVFAVAAGVVGMASPFQSGDHARLALQDPVDPARTAAILRNWLLVGCTASCVLCIVVLPALGSRVALAPVACLSLISLLRVLSSVRVVLLSRAGRSGAIATAGACEGSARSLALIGTAVLGAGMWSLVFGEVAAVLASATLLQRFEPGPAAAGWRLPPGYVHKIMATIGVCVLVGFELNSASVAIGHFCAPAAAGSYAFAYRIASQVTVLLLPLITLEAIPRLLVARGSLEGLLAVSRRERRRLLMIAGPMVAVVVVIAPPIMVLVWHERWREASQMLRWLGLSVGLRLAYSMAKAHLEVVGSFSRILMLSVIDTVLILSTLLVAGHLGSALGMVRGLCGESAFMLLASAWLARRLMRQRFSAP